MDVRAGPPGTAHAGSLGSCDAYFALRCLALGLPITDAEEELLVRSERQLAAVLGIDTPTARGYARCCLLQLRERHLHDVLSLDTDAGRIPDLLDAVTVRGRANLDSVPRSAGVLLLSLHYGPYSSLLVWWLARATSMGLFRTLTVLLRTTETGQYRVSPQRLRELDSVGAWSTDRVQLFDREHAGPRGTVAELAARLGPGDAVLLLPDATLRTPGSGPNLNLGRVCVGVPTGAERLAGMTGATVIPVYIRPEWDLTHQLGFGPASSQSTVSAAPGDVQFALDYLVSHTVLTHPCPWEGWLRSAFPWRARHDIASQGHAGRQARER